MAVKANSPDANTEDREILLSRVFDAPRTLVFDAWTNPAHIANWWGPNGFTNTVHEMDVKPGGVWRVTMHGPDGVDYPNKIVYLEVVRPERLVYKHGDDTTDSNNVFLVTVTFDEQDGKTHLTLHMVFKTAAERNMVVEKFHAIEGGKQTLDRLGAFIAQKQLEGAE